MTGYLEQLIGRVAHGQADTRPASAFRFAFEAVELASIETPGRFQTVVAEPAKAGATPTCRSPAEPAKAGAEPTRRFAATAARPTTPQRRLPREPARDSGRVAPPMVSPQLRAQREVHARPTSSSRSQPRVIIREEPSAWREAEDTATADDTGKPEPIFLLPTQPDAASTIPSREQTPTRTAAADLPPVTVRIGRIEIRREQTKLSERRPPATPRRPPRLGLEEYLNQRRRGER
jgi:hypothetical protein